MGTLINFLIDNYIYVVFIAVLLVLALIGYIVDSQRSAKLRADISKDEETDGAAVPLAAMNANITLGDTVNKMAMNNQQSVNSLEDKKPLDIEK